MLSNRKLIENKPQDILKKVYTLPIISLPLYEVSKVLDLMEKISCRFIKGKHFSVANLPQNLCFPVSRHGLVFLFLVLFSTTFESIITVHLCAATNMSTGSSREMTRCILSLLLKVFTLYGHALLASEKLCSLKKKKNVKSNV